MEIDCPKCGQRVALDAHSIIPFHDNAPPLRSVCRGSMDDATVIVAMLATARAEAALAEREACVSDVRLLTVEPDLVLNGNGASLTEQIDAQAILGALNAAVDMIRARTTPATLSTETLAAIAEARGLRAVKAREEVCVFAEAMEMQLAKNEHKGGWRDDAASELHARLIEESEELHAELMKRRERPGYANNKSAILGEAADVANFAMMIADVCGCIEAKAQPRRDEAHAELETTRAELASLKSRLEAEIAAVVESVRQKTIAECVERVRAVAIALRAQAKDALERDDCEFAFSRLGLAHGVDAAESALAAPQPAPAPAAADITAPTEEH